MQSKLFGAILACAFAGLTSAAESAETVYIPLGSANAVLLVDAAGDRVIGRIDGIEAVHGLAATPDGRLLIAGSYNERQVGSAAPPKPADISEDAHAQHHAASKAAGEATGSVISTVTFISTDSRMVVRRVDVPGAVHHAAVSPDGGFAILTHPNQDRISVLDLGSFAVVATVATGKLPNYAVFSPDGRTVYVSNAGDERVSAVDTGQWNVRLNYDVGASPEHLVLSADGRTLYVNNVDEGTVSVIDLGSGNVTTPYAVGASPHGIGLSADGGTLFVSVMGEDKLVAVNLSAGQVREAALAPSPYHLASINSFGKIYVSSAEEPKLWIVDQLSLKVLGEIVIGGKGHQMVQSGGG